MVTQKQIDELEQFESEEVLKSKIQGVTKMTKKWKCKICGKQKTEKTQTSFSYFFEEDKKRIEPICENCFNDLRKSEEPSNE